MVRVLGIAMMMMLLLPGVVASASDVGQFHMVVGPQGIKVENAEISATAMRISFDTAKELLLLEGSAASPATLAVARAGNTSTLTARRIAFSLKSGAVSASR
jgi:hypothetical protein